MRKRFDQQLKLGTKLISQTPVLQKSRDKAPALIRVLVEIFNNSEYNTKIMNILEDAIIKGKKDTGRSGLNLWQIFVLAEFRVGLKLSYDRLHYMVNSDSVLRQLLGIETESGFKRIEIGYQRILDNVHLLDNTTINKINDIILEFGHGEVFKKKEEAHLRLKTDSYVVESNVHFPTDYGLLWDSSRKALDVIEWFKEEYGNIENWRKSTDWYKGLKNLSRALGRVSSTGGKDKNKRLLKVAQKYITKAKAFRKKLSRVDLPMENHIDFIKTHELEEYIKLIDKHIDLVERRIIHGEKIPHEEKLFSIFEQYTEWIVKGKQRPNVELGKMMSITTDQNGLIIDYHIHENEKDSQVLLTIADRISLKHKIGSWSFDKGYWNKDNKWLLQTIVSEVIMPKKGKRTIKETEEEHSPSFKKLKQKHSAIESNINELEHNGLDRCPDKTYHGYKRYISIGIVAHNLHKIGKELLRQQREKEKKKKRRAARKVA